MKVASVTYFSLALLLSAHCLRYNNYSSDTPEFAGNVVAIQTTDPIAIHHIAYDAVAREAPSMVQSHILGTDLNTNEAAVRRDKHADPYRFVQFLPYFSVKPLYIESLYLVHRAGVGLVRSIAVVSTVSFLVLTILVYLWIRRAGGAVEIGCLILFVPEVLEIGQQAGPDALSTLLLFGGLMGLFYVRPSVGIALLLISIWVRPDNAILALCALAYLMLQGRVPLWMAAVLAGIAVLTPLVIGHFGYGWKALYSHTFKFVEMGPGEFTPTFTATDYLHALLSGMKQILRGDSVIVFLLWIISYNLVPKLRSALGLCALFAIIRFLIYPNFEWRYYAVLYFVTVVAASVAVKKSTLRIDSLSLTDTARLLIPRLAAFYPAADAEGQLAISSLPGKKA